jgi:hypothetical protein
VVEFLPSKQAVAGSSPVSRSMKLGDNLPGLKNRKLWADRNDDVWVVRQTYRN